ncbi:MAG: GGDEF domain-containing protein [Colwellia sp.]
MFSLILKKINNFTAALIESEEINYQHSLLNFTIVFYFCSFVIAVPISLIRVIETGWLVINFFHLLLLFTITCLFFVRKNTSYSKKISILIATFYLVGAVGNYQLGLSSGNYLYFAVSVLLSATFLSLRTTFLILLLIVTTQSAFMYLTKAGLVGYQLSPLIPINNLHFWITHLVAFITVIATPLIAIGWLNSLLKLSQVKLRASNQELLSTKNKLEVLALTDELTSLPNRRSLFSYSQLEFAKFKRNKNSFSVLMIDLDYFKKVNDSYGHDAGDKVLIVVANILLKQIRKYELVARAGGEEFVAILLDTTPEESHLIANRMREAIKNTDIFHDGVYIKITTSIGISHAREADLSFEQILKRADLGVYKAKEKGRDCVAEVSR